MRHSEVNVGVNLFSSVIHISVRLEIGVFSSAKETWRKNLEVFFVAYVNTYETFTYVHI